VHYCLLIALADNIFFRMRLGDYHIVHHHISSPRTTLWSVLWRKPFSQLLPSPLPQFSHPLPALYYTHAASTLYGPSLIQGRVLDLEADTVCLIRAPNDHIPILYSVTSMVKVSIASSIFRLFVEVFEQFESVTSFEEGFGFDRSGESIVGKGTHTLQACIAVSLVLLDLSYTLRSSIKEATNQAH